MKKCFKCKKTKPLSEFYKHPRMSDGHLNKCKDCAKDDTKMDYRKKQADPLFMEKEKNRSKEKYYRLNYKERYSKKKKAYHGGKYSNTRRDLKIPPELTGHHWNYNFIDDVILLKRKFHRYLHRYIRIDQDTLCYRTINGTLLLTKKDHIEYAMMIRKYYIEDFKVY